MSQINTEPEKTQLRTMLGAPLSAIIFLLTITNQPDMANAHGTMIDPVSRNSLWRIDQSAPVNYNDIELFCGGLGVVQQNGGKCGACGDPYNMPCPRPHETGGPMVTNRTVKNYFPGATLDVIIDLETNHGGYFEFELCQRYSLETMETESCFEKLKFVDGSYRWRLATNHSDRGLKSMSLMLPEDLRECRACILRWNYRAGNNWGVCHDGTAATGCGPQELYRNCADISIGYQIHNSDNELANLLQLRSLVRRQKAHSSRISTKSNNNEEQ